MELSGEQKLIPVVYDVLHDSMPSGVADQFRQTAVIQAARQTAHTAEFLHVYSQLHAAGFEPIVVKGIISEIANNGLFGAQYGNGTFWISDDGVRHNDPALDFEAYRVLWLGNRKWQEGDDQIAVGDEVILHGQLTKYGTTYETSSGKAYIFSLNGKTE